MKLTELDFSEFPPGAVTEYTTLVCLACIFDIFTKQIGLAPRSAYSEIKRYSPTVEELTSRKAVRPFFDSDEKHPRCPYCNAAKRWHARLDTYAIEGGKTTGIILTGGVESNGPHLASGKHNYVLRQTGDVRLGKHAKGVQAR